MGFHADIPHFYCKMRAEYAYDLKERHGEFFDVWVFAVDSVAGHAVGFDVLTDFGAMFARLPISALCHKHDAPVMPLDYLELWNNFSYQVEAHEYSVLRHLRCSIILKDRKWYSAEYMFTLSWYGNNFAEDPGEGGFKRNWTMVVLLFSQITEQNGLSQVSSPNHFQTNLILRPIVMCGTVRLATSGRLLTMTNTSTTLRQNNDLSWIME